MSPRPRKTLDSFLVIGGAHDEVTPTKEHEVSVTEATPTVNTTAEQTAGSIGKAAALGISLARLKALKEQLEGEIKLTSDALLDELGEGGSVNVRHGDEIVTFTRSDPTVVTIHDDVLQANLSRNRWARVSKRVADRSKVEAEILVGRIGPELAAKVRTEAPGTPRVVITRKKG